MLSLNIRPRRNRRNAAIRDLVRETTLHASDLVWPIFVMEGSGAEVPIASMPGQFRMSIDRSIDHLRRSADQGLRACALFPVLPETIKTTDAREALNPDGLIPRTILAIKKALPDLQVITDVALDPFSSDGHDGLVGTDGKILNDETVEVLAGMSLLHAQAGADMVAPSDMMDGRIGRIRTVLDNAGCMETGILSYSAKYASSLYGPFRDALDSAPKFGDKKTYQMDSANRREAIREVDLDIAEGADMVMVKPAGMYLDVIREVADHATVPVAAYQVSGEYAMICAAGANGWIDQQRCMMESLTAIRRAGAKIIFSYFAPEVLKSLRE